AGAGEEGAKVLHPARSRAVRARNRVVGENRNRIRASKGCLIVTPSRPVGSPSPGARHRESRICVRLQEDRPLVAAGERTTGGFHDPLAVRGSAGCALCSSLSRRGSFPKPSPKTRTSGGGR